MTITYLLLLGYIPTFTETLIACRAEPSAMPRRSRSSSPLFIASYGKVTSMRANLTLSGLACIIALMSFNPGPAKAQPSAPALDQSSVGGLEQVYYRYRRGYGHRRTVTVTVIGHTATTDARMGTATGPTIHMDTAIRTGVRALTCGSASRVVVPLDAIPNVKKPRCSPRGASSYLRP